MGDVVRWQGITKLDLPAATVLEGALEKDLTDVVVIGWKKDGEFFFASSIAAGPVTLWLLELAKKTLIEIGDNA